MEKYLPRLATAAAAAFCCLAARAAAQPLLRLAAPAENWYDGVPLGNGAAGALLWGGGDTLLVSLDRADFWHNTDMKTYAEPGWTWDNLARLVETKNGAERKRLFHPGLAATKLPGVRLTLKLAKGCRIESFALFRDDGLAEVAVSTPSGAAGTIRAWFDDGDDLLSMQISGGIAVESKSFGDNPSFAKLGGYPAAVVREDSGAFTYFRARREGAANRFDRDFTAGVRWRKRGEKPSSAFWRRFNANSSVSIPDAEMQRLYDTAIYLYGAGARAGNPPLALQGLWTADDNALPPWSGDYHNDLNTEMTYWAAGPAGCIEALEAFADFFIERLPECRAFCKKIFSLPPDAPPAAVIPPTMGLAAQPIGGWSAYVVPPVHGIWVFDTFFDAWLYDPEPRKAAKYLAFGRELAAGLEYAWKPGAGARRFALSCSPEIDDDRDSCFLDANSSYERAILEAFYLRLEMLADACGEKAEAAKWRSYRGTFGPPNIDASGALRISAARALSASHRHPSHLLQIFPLAELPREEGVDAARSVGQWTERGTRLWCGYSFAWAGCFEARLGRGDLAWRRLKDFQQAFVSRNGFHLNGDQLKCGLSAFTYRPFTLEGNFGYARGVQEMLLACDFEDGRPSRARLFPALPKAWDGKEVSFENLRLPGGCRISARRAPDGAVSWSGVKPDGSPMKSLSLE